MPTNSLIQKVKSLYDQFTSLENYMQHPVLLLMRLFWGWQFYMAGKGKLMKLDQTTEFFASLHIPMPHFNAMMAGTTECVGGILLFLGLGSRLISIPLIGTMVVALLTAHIDQVKGIFSHPDELSKADPIPFLLTALVVMAFGPGIFSVDTILAKFFKSPAKQNN